MQVLVYSIYFLLNNKWHFCKNNLNQINYVENRIVCNCLPQLKYIYQNAKQMMMYTVRTAYHGRLQPSSHLSTGVSPLISEHPPDGGAAVLIRHCSSVMAATLVHCVEARANWTPSPQPCLELGLSIYVPCP